MSRIAATRQTSQDSNSLVDNDDKQHSNPGIVPKHQLWWIVVMILGAILTTFGLAYLAMEYIIVKSTYFGDMQISQEHDNMTITHDFQTSWDVTDSIFTAELSDTQFPVYIGFVLFGTLELSGIGLELFVLRNYIPSWSRQLEATWKLAQLLFPLLVVTAIGLATQRNFLCMPLLIAGMWKMGFPETTVYLYLGMFGIESSWRRRCSDILNGLGTACHHSAAAFLVSMLLSGAYPPTRHVLNCALILIIQHWFVLLSSINLWAYCAVEMVLEAWFEWTVISDFWYLYQAHWTGALGTLVFLLAHWLYLIASGIEFTAKESTSGKIENIFVRGSRVSQSATDGRNNVPQRRDSRAISDIEEGKVACAQILLDL